MELRLKREGLSAATLLLKEHYLLFNVGVRVIRVAWGNLNLPPSFVDTVFISFGIHSGALHNVPVGYRVTWCSR